MIRLVIVGILSFALAQVGWAFEMVDLQGKSHRLSQYRGKWVLVNYWATWCPPCLVEIPDLIALHNNPRNNLVVLGVAMEFGDDSHLQSFASRRGIPYPIIRHDQRITEQVGPARGLPTSYLYDPYGRLATYNVGLLTREGVERFIGAGPPSGRAARR